MINSKVPNLFHCSLLISVLIILACQKMKDKSTTALNDNDHPVFSKTVGGPIDSSIANLWKRNLANKLNRSRSAATTTTVYYLPAAVLEGLIRPEEATGIIFYYGQDSTGNVHLMSIAVNIQGSVMRTEMVQTTDGVISWATAVAWGRQFREKHPDGIWGHFWGKIAVSNLIAESGAEVRFSLGENDEGVSQMMFSSDATEGSSEEGDMTTTCPHACPRGFY